MTALPSSGHVTDVRSLSVAVYRNCLERNGSVEDAIVGDPRTAVLPSRDRALLANILLTGFRHKGEIEAVLKKLLDRPLPRKSGSAMDILFLAVAQLLFLKMPAHAVIDLSVRAAKADRYAMHFSGLVNAVLRKVAAAGPNMLTGLDPAALNTPNWLWDRWVRNYGTETTRLIGLANTQRPALDLSFKGGQAAGRLSLAVRFCRTANCVFPPITRPCLNWPVSMKAAGGCRTRRRPYPSVFLGTSQD